MTLDMERVSGHIDAAWEGSITPTLVDYVRIPNVSVAYDADWEAHGHMDRAVELAREWCVERAIAGLTVSVERLPGRTPVLLCDIPAFGAAASSDRTVLLYGHLDKQPPMHGWRAGLGPWEPVIEDGRLYGRGGADDGYATFASLAAIEALQAAGASHARCVVIAECSEESGSPDLPAHLHALGDRIGNPSLVVCLDSGCATYDRLWVTTSLRGNLIADLRVDVLTEGVHSGNAGGVVPSSFRIMRRLLDRIEDPDTGRILLPELQTTVPEERRSALAATAAELGAGLTPFPYAGTTQSPWDGAAADLLAKTWQASLAVTGMDGIPPGAEAGNVLRPFTQATLSFRLPPGVDPDAAGAALGAALEADPPHGAQVRFTVHSAEAGWDAPATEPWLAAALDAASETAFGRPSSSIGEGGTIPFMAMLGHQFPDAQFLITGVLGPGANAHGPNEFLHLPTAVRLTECLSLLVRAHATR